MIAKLRWMIVLVILATQMTVGAASAANCNIVPPDHATTLQPSLSLDVSVSITTTNVLANSVTSTLPHSGQRYGPVRYAMAASDPSEVETEPAEEPTPPLDVPIPDDLMEILARFANSIRPYLEQVQDTVEAVIPDIDLPAMDPEPGSEPEVVDEPPPSFTIPIIDDLMDTLVEFRETVAGFTGSIRSYLEQVEDSIRDLVPYTGIFDSDRAPAEEPPPAVTPPSPTTGMIEGWLAEDTGSPLSGVRLAIGPRETTTDSNGFFLFEDMEFGSYDLYLSDSSVPDEVLLASFEINEQKYSYSVNLIVSLPDSDDETEEAVVITGPVEEADDTAWTPLIILGVASALIVAVLVLLLLTRKHIRIVDARTGKTLETQRIELLPRTRIDLTEAFEYASTGAVRVQFLGPAVRKLSRSRVLFLKDDEVIGEIDDYSGELEYLVKLPEAADEEALEARFTNRELGERRIQETNGPGHSG